MTLEVAAADQLGQHVLLKARHAAGVEPELFLKGRSELPGKHHVTDAHGRRNGSGKGIQVDHVVLLGEGEERLHGLGRDGELGAVVGLNEKPPGAARPADVLVALGGRRGNAAGEAPIGRGVQHVGLRSREGGAVDAVPGQRQMFADRAGGAIDLLELLVGRRFDGVHPAAAQQIDNHSVEIFRAGADDDLIHFHANAAVAGEVLLNGPAKLRASGIGRFLQQHLRVFREYPAHGSAQDGDREAGVVGCGQLWIGLRRALFVGGVGGEAVRRLEDDEVAAALPGFGVALLAEQCVGVLDGDGADARLVGQQALGGEPFAMSERPAHHVVPQLTIELKVNRAIFLAECVFHLTI